MPDVIRVTVATVLLLVRPFRRLLPREAYWGIVARACTVRVIR